MTTLRRNLYFGVARIYNNLIWSDTECFCPTPELSFVSSLQGSTVTLALVIGPLLTVANTGDSLALLDTGCSVLPMTTSHRVQVSHHIGVREKPIVSRGFFYLTGKTN